MKWLRYILPFAVSAAILVWILGRIGAREAVESVTPRAAIGCVIALAVYLAVTLGLEALSYGRAAQGTGARAPLGTWARVKAASYPLQMLHHTLGLASLTYLIQRHLRFPLSVVIGIIALVTLFDMMAMLSVVAIASASGGVPGLTVPAAAPLALISAMIGGLWLLRSSVPLGPLEPIRQLGPLVAAREAPLHKLGELAVLRVLFFCSFIGLWGACLAAFGIDVPAPRLAIGIALVVVVSALPIAVSGFGTSQATFLAVFEDVAAANELLACSLFVSVMLVLMRIGLGLLFAGEFTREAFRGAREELEHEGLVAEKHG